MRIFCPLNSLRASLWDRLMAPLSGINSTQAFSAGGRSSYGGEANNSIFLIAVGSSNGRTWAFEAQYLGSNPSPTAMRKMI